MHDQELVLFLKHLLKELILDIIDPPLIQVVRFPPSRGWYDGRRKAGWRGCLIFCV